MPAESEKLNSKRLFITLGIVIITAGAIGGSVYYVMDQQAKKDKETANKQTQDLLKQVEELKKAQTNTTTTTTTADPTANWKTYTNASLDFSFKYPDSYTIKDESATHISADETVAPWYMRPNYAKLDLLISRNDNLNLWVYKTIDPNQISSSNGAEGNKLVSTETKGNDKVYTFTMGASTVQYYKAIIHNGYAYVIGYPSSKSLLDSIFNTITFD
ncbi:MAG: hypothetical protein M1355_00140 [Patescibacteria group bacterium]|nr:hypothetical protein [Patescibacteria group bacterium]